MATIINASRLAAFIGLSPNPHVSKKEAFDRMLNKPEKPVPVPEKVEMMMTIPSANSNELRGRIKEAQDVVKSDPVLTISQKREVCQNVESTLTKNYGITNEDKVLKNFENFVNSIKDEEEEEVKIQIQKDQRIYYRKINNKYTLNGRIDSWEIHPDGTRIIIETKNRKNNLFHSLREYEKIQVHAYFYLFPNIKCAKLVERVDDEMDYITIERDDN
jgi:hypothetical protein